MDEGSKQGRRHIAYIVGGKFSASADDYERAIGQIWDNMKPGDSLVGKLEEDAEEQIEALMQKGYEKVIIVNELPESFCEKEQDNE